MKLYSAFCWTLTQLNGNANFALFYFSVLHHRQFAADSSDNDNIRSNNSNNFDSRRDDEDYNDNIATRLDSSVLKKKSVNNRSPEW